MVTHTLRIGDDLPLAPTHVRVGPAFEITASYSATGQLAQPALPITITVGYTDLNREPAVADTLALYYWDGSAWVTEPSSALDQAARRLRPRRSAWAPGRSWAMPGGRCCRFCGARNVPQLRQPYLQRQVRSPQQRQQQHGVEGNVRPGPAPRRLPARQTIVAPQQRRDQHCRAEHTQ